MPKKTELIRLSLLIAVLVVLRVSPALAEKIVASELEPGSSDATSIEADGKVYGAQANEVGPIGGGEGYVNAVVSGGTKVGTVEELIAALPSAQPGDTIFVPGDADFDFTVWVRADEFVLKIPEGVTLASDRGVEGSPGAILYSDEILTKPLIEIVGRDVRITGIRLRGPDPKIRRDFHHRCFKEGGPAHALYYKFPTSDGILCEQSGLEIDNCEISGWSHAGVYLKSGTGHHIHHNFIHHNQRHGLGYGVSHNAAESLIEYNLFDYNRHSIAGTGRPGCSYEARHNVVGPGANGHYYDMHGGRDRKDGTAIAGTWMKVTNNTFLGSSQRGIVIRGIPEKEAVIRNNWFQASVEGKTDVGTDGNTVVEDNFYGIEAP